MIRTLTTAAVLAGLAGCSGQASTAQAVPEFRASASAPVAVDSVRLLADIEFLSSTELGGRGVGTEGNARARAHIEREFATAGIVAFDGGYPQTFARAGGGQGTNVIGFVRGTARPDRYIVVTAHYDHLGTVNGTVFHGADDNASGTAALIEIGRQLAAEPPPTSVILAAVDAEEVGLRGARAFVASPPVPLEAIILNVNLDMVSRSDGGALYAAGTYHYPDLGAILDPVSARSEIEIRTGHDRPDLPPGDDWTVLSDHAAFYERGIPFIYFGVEDHPDYHRPTDTFQNIDPAFFVQATRTILDFVREAARAGLNDD